MCKEKKQTTLADLPGGDRQEHADWLIGPVGRHRDSDLIERSNWQVVTECFSALDPDGADHDVHRFGHFAVGWIEEIAYRPGSAVAAAADEIRASLASYPILDEHAHSALETEALDENMPAILSDLRRDLLTEFRARRAEAIADGQTEGHADDDELTEWLDGFSDDLLWTLARDLGEQHADWISWRHSIDEIADALLADDSTAEEESESP